jgi:putative endonuclease
MLDDMKHAIAREKQIKGWKRELKVKIIKKDNPEWNDLYPNLF